MCLIPACSASIVSFVKRKIGQGVTTITSSEIEEADALRTGLPALCVAYLPSLEVSYACCAQQCAMTCRHCLSHLSLVQHSSKAYVCELCPPVSRHRDSSSPLLLPVGAAAFVPAAEMVTLIMGILT